MFHKHRPLQVLLLAVWLPVHQGVLAEYYGKFIGHFKELTHNVAGAVYAASEDAFYLVNFTYDGQAPEVFFWAGVNATPDGHGEPLADENGAMRPLGLYDRATVLVRLRGRRKINDYRYLSVYSRSALANFGWVVIPDSFKLPGPQYLGVLKGVGEVISDGVVLLDSRTIFLSKFAFVGSRSGEVQFMVGNGDVTADNGHEIDKNSSCWNGSRDYGVRIRCLINFIRETDRVPDLTRPPRTVSEAWRGAAIIWYQAMAPVLGYWNVRSLAQPIRNLLVYKGVAFEDKQYKFGPPPDYDLSVWHKGEKYKLGLTFPNLPYYIDGDVKLTQSLAILRYLGRKHDLAARNEREMTELDVIEQQARDLCLTLINAAAPNPTAEHGLESYVEKMSQILRSWDDFLASRKWTMGDRLTYVDFLLYEGLDWHREFKPSVVQGYQNIVDYLKRFEKLPNMEEYFASDRYIKWPILGPFRTWGYRKSSK